MPNILVFVGSNYTLDMCLIFCFDLILYFSFYSLIYMNIEAMVDGEVFKVDSVIPEQYNLKKLWKDIKDLCFDGSIRQAEDVKFKNP